MILIIGHGILIYTFLHMSTWPWRPIGAKEAFRIVLVGFLGVVISQAGLAIGIWSQDLSIKYIFEHGSKGLEALQQIGLLWAGHEGANLFFLGAVLLSALIAMGPYRKRESPLPFWTRIYIAYHIGGLGGLILTLSSPFERLWPFPPIRAIELNPLLSDYALSYHPPLLLGATALFFSIALGDVLHRDLALQTRSLIKDSATLSLVESPTPSRFFPTRLPWISHHLGLLLLGMTAGGYWAYHVLGWGGWWFWDPVETISFLTFSSGLVLLHQHAEGPKSERAPLGPWAWAGVLSTLWLVRSDQIVSVHSFITKWSDWPWLLFAMGSGLLAFRGGRGVRFHPGSTPRLWGVLLIWGVVAIGLFAPVIGSCLNQPFHLSPLFFEQNLLHGVVFFLAYRASKRHGALLSGLWLGLVVLEPSRVIYASVLGLMTLATLFSGKMGIKRIAHASVLSFIGLCCLQREFSAQEERVLTRDNLITFQGATLELKATEHSALDEHLHTLYHCELTFPEKDPLPLSIEKIYIPSWQQEKTPIVYINRLGASFGFCVAGREGYIKLFYRPYMGLILGQALTLGGILWGWGVISLWRHYGRGRHGRQSLLEKS